MNKKDVQYDDLMDGQESEMDNSNDASRSKNVRQYKVRKRIEALQEETRMKQFLDFDSYMFEE